MAELRTERLLLGTLTRDEALAIGSGERGGRAWADDYPTEGDVVVAGIVCEAGEHYEESADLGVYQIRRAADGLVIGGVGFLSAPDPTGAAEIGYGLTESARGLGYATEAVRAVIEHAGRCGVTVVVAMTAVDNRASQRVLERLAFERGDTVEDDGDDGPLVRWESHLAPRESAVG
jgi:GNAT superfamily N-acetyltransferase